MHELLSVEQKQEVAGLYNKILDIAEKLGVALDGSVFVDEINELVERQTKDLNITL